MPDDQTRSDLSPFMTNRRQASVKSEAAKKDLKSQILPEPPATAYNAKPGRSLFCLPAELRLQIYDYIFPPEKRFHVTSAGLQSPPALLETCRIIRNEAIGIFYRNSLFTTAIFCGPLAHARLFRWTARIEKRYSLSLHLLYHMPGHFYFNELMDVLRVVYANPSDRIWKFGVEESTCVVNELRARVSARLEGRHVLPSDRQQEAFIEPHVFEMLPVSREWKAKADLEKRERARVARLLTLELFKATMLIRFAFAAEVGMGLLIRVRRARR